jgi:hypothetical protein
MIEAAAGRLSGLGITEEEAEEVLMVDMLLALGLNDVVDQMLDADWGWGFGSRSGGR